MKSVSPFKSLQRIHTAMLAGMVLFGIVSAVVHVSKRAMAGASLDKILQVSILALSFALIKTGLTIFERRLQAIRGNASPSEKITVYRMAAIVKWAMMEIPVLMSVIAFIVTRNYAFMVLAFVLMLLFVLQGPIKEKMLIQLRMTAAEAALLEENLK